MRMKSYLVSIIYIVIGSVLIGFGFAGKVDEFWNGAGCGWLIVGILQMIRFYRLRNNDEYRERMEIELSDERNHFIRGKAWTWTGYLFFITAGILSIVFRIIGQELLSLAASYALCFMLMVYWVSYYFLKRKY